MFRSYMKQKEIIMNKFKKLAVSALGASLAATSANALDITVSGGSEVGYQWGSGNYEASSANAFGAASDIDFSGSGELDNGWTVSTVYGSKASWALSSANVSIDTGSMGKFRVNRLGAAASNGNDDILPTAWEEANDQSGHATRGMDVADAMTSGSLSYISPTFDMGGGTVSFTLDYDTAPNVAGGDPGAAVSRASATGRGTAAGVKISHSGLTLAVAHSEVESEAAAAANDQQASMAQIIYSAGPVAVGYGEWYVDEKDGAVDYSATGFGISFNVNDDLSISYGELTDTREANGATKALDTDMSSMQIAYSMGSMSIKAKRVETDNPYHTSSKTEENSEISLSFSF